MEKASFKDLVLFSFNEKKKEIKNVLFIERDEILFIERDKVLFSFNERKK